MMGRNAARFALTLLLLLVAGWMSGVKSDRSASRLYSSSRH